MYQLNIWHTQYKTLSIYHSAKVLFPYLPDFAVFKILHLVRSTFPSQLIVRQTLYEAFACRLPNLYEFNVELFEIKGDAIFSSSATFLCDKILARTVFITELSFTLKTQATVRDFSVISVALIKISRSGTPES